MLRVKRSTQKDRKRKADIIRRITAKTMSETPPSEAAKRQMQHKPYLI